MPTIDPETVPDDAIERGAYVVRANENGDDPDVILIGTGSEVSLALEAADKLAENDVDVRVVSMPCMENFDEQDDEYRDRPAPRSTRAWPSRRPSRSAGTAGSARWARSSA